ncbi:MAG: hypothetical protein ACD_73C00570G0002 [uncultured bacterium]|nr:MAG: hypothetical protein ACD_73C00570G0002 [uncultured bacterium]
MPRITGLASMIAGTCRPSIKTSGINIKHKMMFIAGPAITVANLNRIGLALKASGDAAISLALSILPSASATGSSP